MVSFMSPADAVARGIPKEVIIGVLPPSVLAIKQSTIRLNPSFVLFLQKVIAEHGPTVPNLMKKAVQVGSGSLVVIDARASTHGHQQESEDVFGVFQVEEDRIISNSYQPNPDYLLVSKKGLFVLDAWLHSKLLEELAKAVKRLTS